MQKAKILAPCPNAKDTNNEILQNLKTIPSFNLEVPALRKISNSPTFQLKGKDLKEFIDISKSKSKDIRRMKMRNKLVSQKEKVRQLLDQINSHLDSAIGNNITIADVTGKCRPICQEFERLPYIHFGCGLDKPQDYLPNPFKMYNSCYSTTSSKYSSTENKDEISKYELNLLSENNAIMRTNYCGHCRKHFVNGAAHRLSGYHQMTIASAKHWEKIDNLCQHVCTMPTFCREDN